MNEDFKETVMRVRSEEILKQGIKLKEIHRSVCLLLDTGWEVEPEWFINTLKAIQELSK